MTDLVDDLETVVETACSALETVLDRDWSVPADGLEWTCWGTIEHTADDLFAYAAQIAGRRPALDTYVPFAEPATRRPSRSCADARRGRAPATPASCRCWTRAAVCWSRVARQADPAKRGGHPYGISDPEGFAAMGTVETLLHLHDVAGPLGLAWDPGPRRRTTGAGPAVPGRSRPTATRGRRCCGVTGATRQRRWTSWRWDGRSATERLAPAVEHGRRPRSRGRRSSAGRRRCPRGPGRTARRTPRSR